MGIITCVGSLFMDYHVNTTYVYSVIGKKYLFCISSFMQENICIISWVTYFTTVTGIQAHLSHFQPNKQSCLFHVKWNSHKVKWNFPSVWWFPREKSSQIRVVWFKNCAKRRNCERTACSPVRHSLLMPTSPLPCFSSRSSMWELAGGTFSGRFLTPVPSPSLWSNRRGRQLIGDLGENQINPLRWIKHLG